MDGGLLHSIGIILGIGTLGMIHGALVMVGTIHTTTLDTIHITAQYLMAQHADHTADTFTMAIETIPIVEDILGTTDMAVAPATVHPVNMVMVQAEDLQGIMVTILVVAHLPTIITLTAVLHEDSAIRQETAHHVLTTQAHHVLITLLHLVPLTEVSIVDIVVADVA